MTEYFSCVDWLSFTMPKSDSGALFDVPDFIAGLDCLPGIPHFGYRQAVVYPCGMSIMYDGSTPTMGAHYQYSGQALNNLRESGIATEEILKWHSDSNHRCTRCDLAIDVKGDNMFGWELDYATEHGERDGTAKKVQVVKSMTDQGMTVYIGSRSSDIFCRIYNKAAEQKLEGSWWRCEVEVKGKAAQLTADRVMLGGEECVKALASAELRKRVGFGFQSWQDMISGEVEPLQISEVKERKTRIWLLSTCVKALVRYELEHPGTDLLEEFSIAVREMKTGRQNPV